MVKGEVLLLDTNILLWIVGEPERISPRARKALDESLPWVSVASYWEIVIKSAKGQIAEIADPVSWWERAMKVVGAETLSIRSSHITALAALPAVHKDPFDRILIAQAVAEGLALVTPDPHMAKYPVKVVWK